METTFDCVILGGGSAGYAAARTALGHGLTVAVVDGAAELGGLCILRGCMPSKSLIESANRFHSMRRAAEFGLRADAPRALPAEIQARKQRLIADFAGYRAGQLTDGRFPLFRGQARFVSPHEVAVAGPDLPETRLHARTYVVATGSRIALPSIPGLRESSPMTSDDVLDSDTLPDSLIVLGGGPIALELAWYHHALGVPVTLLQRSPRLVRSVDRDLAASLESALRADGMTIETGTTLIRVERENNRTTVHYRQNDTEKSVAAAALLYALGREPATGTLGLEAAGLPVGPKPGLTTDLAQTTSQPHIFAAGDVCGPHEIVHIAIAQGEAAATNAAVLLGKLPASARQTMDYRDKLFAMFTHPELACVGLGEDEAGDRAVLCATYPFDDHGKSMVMGETRGFVKLVADADTGELLGGGVVGPHASELIHEVAVAVSLGITARRFARVPHYHPTLSEIWTYPAEEIAEKIAERSNPARQ